MFSLMCATPEKLLFEEEIKSVILPGYEGELEVLAGHAPTIIQLKEGIVEVTKNTSLKERFRITGGICEVTPLICRLLIKEATPLKK